MPLDTVKGSHLQPLFEFHGACPGCGETPYIKVDNSNYMEIEWWLQMQLDVLQFIQVLLLQPIYKKNGEGPSWGSSLFEDNAEYGFGMHVGAEALRSRNSTY